MHYASLLFVARRLVHYILAGLIVPGCWLLADVDAKDPRWMAGSIKAFRRSSLSLSLLSLAFSLLPPPPSLPFRASLPLSPPSLLSLPLSPPPPLSR